MKSWVLAVGLLAAAASGQAMAADLDDGPPRERYGAYDDPRYADIYRYPDRRGHYAEADPYRRHPLPRERVYRDDRDDHYPDPRRYSYRDHRDRCVPREHIKHRLHHQGWHDFHDAEVKGEFASVVARRPSGRKFELTLHRCSGEIVHLRRLDGRPYGPYAHGGNWHRRWDRPY